MEKAIHKLNRIGAYISAAVLLLMVLFDTATVVGRYLFNKPIKGDLEIQELMMVVIVFLALGLCTQERLHVYIEILVQHFKGQTLMISKIFDSLFSLVVVALMFWRSLLIGINDIQTNDMEFTGIVHIPAVPFIFVADLGMLLMAISFLIELIGYVNSAAKTSRVAGTKEVMQNG